MRLVFARLSGFVAALFLGCGLTCPSFAQPDLTLDLATVTPTDGLITWVYGARGLGNLGLPVAGGADLDGDGFPDTAVAFMRADALGRDAAGEVDLVFGDGTIGGFLDTATPHPRILRFAGGGPKEAAGSELWIDDVTGDGLGDLLICRQNHNPGGRIGAGALTIVVGSAALRTQALALTTVDLLAPPMGVTLTTLIGANPIDRLGIWARTGDLTGDGIADIVVAADQEDVAGQNNSGALYVVRGGPHLAAGGTIDLAQFGTTALPGNLAKITPPSAANGFHFGATCQLADLDGNGRAEVLAAATLNRAGASIPADGAVPGSAESSGGAPHGILYIAWDDNLPAGVWANGLNFKITAPPGSTTVIFGGSVQNVNFGEEILGGLDYDHDGAADLFVGDLTGDGTADQSRGVSGIGYVFYRARALKGLQFNLGSALPPGIRISKILGPQTGAISADTAAHGDFDGDRVDDLAFSSPHAAPFGRINAGILHVFYGQPGGWPALIDTQSGALPPTAQVRVGEILGAHGQAGGDRGDTLCYSAAYSDLDADGRIDIITNEMVGNGLAPGSIDAGNLILIGGAQTLTGPSVFVDGFASGNLSEWSQAVGTVAEMAEIGISPPSSTTSF